MGSAERDNPVGCYPTAGRDRAEGEGKVRVAFRESNYGSR